MMYSVKSKIQINSFKSMWGILLNADSNLTIHNHEHKT